MTDAQGRMTPDEFRAALALLGMSQGEFARFLVEMGDVAGDKERTVQRWATGQQDIPGPVLVLLKVLAVVEIYTGMNAKGIAANALPPGGASPEGEAKIIEDRRQK